MNGVQQFDSLDTCSCDRNEPIHLAIGMFDGIHVGHRLVIDSAINVAKRDGGKSGVLTFWPHPSRLFRPDDPTRMILSPELKRRELSKQSIDFEIQEPFSQKLAEIEACDFVSFLKERLPSLKSIHVGDNWRFGKGRKGDAALLTATAAQKGVAVKTIRCRSDGEGRVSSTRIRDLLKQGATERANELLGYAYYSVGTVTQGKRMGRKMGVPTLNLPFEGDLKPAYGVYAVTLSEVLSKRTFKGVANFGVKPTVQLEGSPILEVHLFDECVFDYGHRLKVNWLHFIRQERKFNGLDELKSQIELDLKVALGYFDAIRNG